MLGSGVQQSDPPLPRAPVGGVLAGAAPHHRRAGVGGARRHGARVGHALQGQRAHAGGTHRHRGLARVPGRRAAGTSHVHTIQVEATALLLREQHVGLFFFFILRCLSVPVFRATQLRYR